MMTEIFEIRAYRDTVVAHTIFGGKVLSYLGDWVFDDESRGIKAEPFVGDTNVIIDAVVKHIPNSRCGVKLLFSEEQFEGCVPFPLVKGAKSNGGCWYSLTRADGVSLKGWLCKVLYKYFPKAPRNIWFKVQPIETVKA